jgi:hypothetical protein
MLLVGLVWFLGAQKPNQLVFVLVTTLRAKTNEKPTSFGYDQTCLSMPK